MRSRMRLIQWEAQVEWVYPLSIIQHVLKAKPLSEFLIVRRYWRELKNEVPHWATKCEDAKPVDHSKVWASKWHSFGKSSIWLPLSEPLTAVRLSHSQLTFHFRKEKSVFVCSLSTYWTSWLPKICNNIDDRFSFRLKVSFQLTSNSCHQLLS